MLPKERPTVTHAVIVLPAATPISPEGGYKAGGNDAGVLGQQGDGVAKRLEVKRRAYD